MTGAPAGPHIVLIGGPMKVDDASSLDSRQVVEGDPTSEVARRALAMSRIWWTAVESVVLPVLDSAGTDAFAVVMGVRSVVQILSDGTTKFSRLSKLLRGGVTTSGAVIVGPSEQLPPDYEKADRHPTPDGKGYFTIGLRRSKTKARWHFVNWAIARPEDVTEALGPAVVVSTDRLMVDDEYFISKQFTAWEKSVLYSPDCVLVLPHTAGAEVFLNRYLEWIKDGRPPDTDEVRPYTEFDPDSLAAFNSLSTTTAVPVSDRFAVTGLIRGNEWVDPAELEAARALLQSRYDLKIGIWDLVGNTTLRQSLLDVSPVEPVPSETAPVPKGARRRNEAAMEAGHRRMMSQEEQLAQMVIDLEPLAALGWRLGVGNHSRTFRLPLVEVPRVASDDPPTLDVFAQPDGVVSLLHLDLAVISNHANLSAYSPMHGVIDVGAYAEQHRAVLEEIAHPAVCTLGEDSPSLWRVSPGLGLDADWRARGDALAVKTPRWIEVFSALAEQCRRARSSQGHPIR